MLRFNRTAFKKANSYQSHEVKKINGVSE